MKEIEITMLSIVETIIKCSIIVLLAPFDFPSWGVFLYMILTFQNIYNRTTIIDKIDKLTNNEK